MLVLSRKAGERIMVGPIVLTVLKIRGNVQLGCQAPIGVPIWRSEAVRPKDPPAETNVFGKCARVQDRGPVQETPLTEVSRQMETRLMIALSEGELLAECQEYCSFKGISVRTVKGGVECLRELRQSSPDALVLDADLPWGGGEGVLEVMGEEARLARVPVVLLLNGDGIAALGRRLPPNVVGCLAKPADVETLLDSAFSAADCHDLLEYNGVPTSESDHTALCQARQDFEPLIRGRSTRR